MEGQISAETDVDAMLRMYELLREEILQSNGLQQRIVLGLATFVGLVFSLVFSGVLSQSDGLPSSSVEVVLGAVIPIIAAATGIWLVEQSRVMMAGNYLYLLEHKLNEAIGEASMSWESWLRRKPSHLPSGVPTPDDGEYNDPQDIYNLAYRLGYLLFFFALGGVTMVLYLFESVVTDVRASGVITLLDWLQVGYGVLAILPSVVLFFYGRKVISHAGQGLTIPEADESDDEPPTWSTEEEGDPVIWYWEKRAFESGTTTERDNSTDLAEAHRERLDELGVGGETDEERVESLLDLAERAE